MPASSSFGFVFSFLLAVPTAALHSLSVSAEGSLQSAVLQSGRRKRRSQRQTLDNFHDVHYSVQIQVGKQKIMAMLDTGAYELMVFDRTMICEGCDESTATLFDPQSSETLHIGEWQADHDFLGGHMQSLLCRDKVSAGELEAVNQYFWLVKQAKMPAMDLDGFQAILGLAPPGQPLEDAVAQAKQASDAYEMLNASGTVDEETEHWKQDSQEFVDELSNEDSLFQAFAIDTFSICLEPHLGAPGHITWRDALPDSYDSANPFDRLPVVGHEEWTVQMTSAALGEASVGCEEGCAVVFDTASPLIAVPQAVFDRVQAVLEGLEVDCTDISSLPTLRLNLGDSVLTLGPETYMGEVYGEVSEALSHFWPNPAVGMRTCRPLLMVFDAPTQWGPLWVLGMPFFRSHYTIFHLGQQDESPEANIPNRAVYVAPQSGDACERPSAAQEMSLRDDGSSRGIARHGERLAAGHARHDALPKIDLALLHPPRWARAGAGKILKL